MKQILIIEDDPRIAGLERDYLEAAGLQASVAADGPSGLRTALDGRFDLILLDIMLPGMDWRFAAPFAGSRMYRLS